MHVFGQIVPLIIGLGLLILLYQVFLSDAIGQKFKASRELDEHFDSVNKIARVKLTSDDPKEIEKFITDNTKFLSDQMVNSLIARIGQIKDDRVIKGDDWENQVHAPKKAAQK